MMAVLEDETIRPADGTGSDAATRKEAMKFTVFQWNILADCLSKDENCPRKYLEYPYRSKLIFAEIERQNPDFICLQEVDHYADYIEPHLNGIGYEGIYCHRKVDGIALFWKKDKITLIKSDTKKLCDAYGVDPSFVQCAIYANFKIEQKDTEQQQTHHFPTPKSPLKFEKIEPEVRNLVVVVTHLKAGLGYYPVRNSQVAIMIDHLKTFIGDQKDIPIVLAGDLNDFPTGDLYKYLLNGEVTTNFYGSKNHPLLSWFLQYCFSKKLYEVILLQSILVLLFATLLHYAVLPKLLWLFFFIPTICTILCKLYSRWRFSSFTKFDHPFQLKSAYSHYKKDFKLKGNYFLLNPFIPSQRLIEGPYTVYIKKLIFHWKVTVDYIWYTKNTLKVKNILMVPPENSLTFYLPSKDYPSDHLPLMAEFQFSDLDLLKSK